MKYDGTNLKEVLEAHKRWLEKSDGWSEDDKADFSNADLHYADLRYADLRYADLSNADLRYADLRYADLRYADLRYADLHCADLHCADLRYADLRYADLRYADLSNADLRYADLRYANLHCADLRYADLHCADLHCADLHCADLRYAKNAPFIPYACPDFGMFIAWKKALKINAKNRHETVLIELEIPEDARRSSSAGRKCRCDKAKVLSIRDLDGNAIDDQEAMSHYDNDFIYRVGETVAVDDFDNDRWNECGTGIHFFINRQEAADYDF